MRAEEGDESIEDYAAEAHEARKRVGRGSRRPSLRQVINRLGRLFRRE